MKENISAFHCPNSNRKTRSYNLLFPNILFLSSSHLINSSLISVQQRLIQPALKQMIITHNTNGWSWSLILISCILFTSSINLLGCFPFTPTTQLSINLGMTVPIWAGALIADFCHKTKASLSYFLPQGTPVLLISFLVIVKTISLFIQPIALSIWLTANITAVNVNYTYN